MVVVADPVRVFDGHLGEAVSLILSKRKHQIKGKHSGRNRTKILRWVSGRVESETFVIFAVTAPMRVVTFGHFWIECEPSKLLYLLKSFLQSKN